MIAYFAILAFVPLLFLALSLLAFAGEQDESSYLVEELERAFPENSVENILDAVTEIQEQATELSVIGGIGLIWAALGFFSVLESAFNIVYGLPNRPFIRQKSLVLVLTAASLIVLFLALVISSVGVELVQRAGVAEGFVSYVYALLVSTALLLGLTWSLYRLLTNTASHLARDPARRGRRLDPAPGELPDTAGLRAPLERADRVAGLRRPRAAPRLALRDGEHPRARRRGELVARPRAARRRAARRPRRRPTLSCARAPRAPRAPSPRCRDGDR